MSTADKELTNYLLFLKVSFLFQQYFFGHFQNTRIFNVRKKVGVLVKYILHITFNRKAHINWQELHMYVQPINHLLLSEYSVTSSIVSVKYHC